MMAGVQCSASTRSRPRHALRLSTLLILAAAALARADDLGTPALPPGQGPILRKPMPAAAQAPSHMAYAAYLDGDLATARHHYQELLRRDPASAEASNGLASLALREGRPDEAIAWFRHSLALAPLDALAHGRLADLDHTLSPQDAESRLRRLIALQAPAAVLHFALGNALARQGRWAEAQQAYFHAHTLDAGDPDILFNLAASLDRLRQQLPAANFYRLALTAAHQRPASFDPLAASGRLQDLEQP